VKTLRALMISRRSVLDRDLVALHREDVAPSTRPVQVSRAIALPPVPTSFGRSLAARTRTCRCPVVAVVDEDGGGEAVRPVGLLDETDLASGPGVGTSST